VFELSTDFIIARFSAAAVDLEGSLPCS